MDPAMFEIVSKGGFLVALIITVTVLYRDQKQKEAESLAIIGRIQDKFDSTIEKQGARYENIIKDQRLDLVSLNKDQRTTMEQILKDERESHGDELTRLKSKPGGAQ